VRSPGVPRDAPPLAAAYADGTPVWSEIELASRALPNPILAITGTNGKTTTTELLAHILRDAGLDAVACGNQGTPLASLVGRVPGDAWLVVECSSFQLEDIPSFHPRGAVLLNVTPDHMDRYPDFDAYRAAKLNIFANQAADDLAILPRPLLATGAAPTRRLAAAGDPGPDAVAWAEGGLHVQGLGRVAAWEDVPLRGAHNRENVMAAAAMAAVVEYVRLQAPVVSLYVNAYNGYTLLTMLDAMPVASIRDLDGGKVWSTRTFAVGGVTGKTSPHF
jgi:UDP-N-acetylmuramoylalanine--D-glutamate ligase